MPAIKRTIGLFLLLGLLLFGAGAWAASAQSSPEDQLQLGAQLFAEYCAACHGPDGQGRVGATLAKDWPSVRPDLTVKNIIISGIPGSAMPAWSNTNGGPLDAAQIEALTAYILSWQTGGAANIIIVPTPTPLPPVTPVPNVTGDTVNGAALFQVNCIMCHGEGGQGKIGRTLPSSGPASAQTSPSRIPSVAGLPTLPCQPGARPLAGHSMTRKLTT